MGQDENDTPAELTPEASRERIAKRPVFIDRTADYTAMAAVIGRIIDVKALKKHTGRDNSAIKAAIESIAEKIVLAGAQRTLDTPGPSEEMKALAALRHSPHVAKEGEGRFKDALTAMVTKEMGIPPTAPHKPTGTALALKEPTGTELAVREPVGRVNRLESYRSKGKSHANAVPSANGRHR